MDVQNSTMGMWRKKQHKQDPSFSKVLRSIMDAPWYYINDYIHRDLKISTIEEDIKRLAVNYEERLHSYGNTEMQCWTILSWNADFEEPIPLN